MAQRYNQDYTSTLPRPLPAEVTRTVLLERIARAGDAGLVVLAAPSGYGKTTLLGQLARASKRAAWLTLSDHHADLETLSDDLMVSITQVAKEVTFERVRRAVAEGAQVATLATPFARELDALSVNVKILIDQANLLGSDALAWLESFALALGEGHQLVYCAYDFAPERLAAPLAAGRALLLTAPDLAFSEEEIRSYLTSRGSSADVFEVQQYLEGWPAGIGLAAAGIVHAMPHDELLSAALEQLPKNVRQALPEASVLRVWREADAARLGCHLPTGWLREVRRVGLPLTPLNAQAYRPHTLALALLDRELKGRPERYRELHIQAARGAQQRGDLVTALQHFRQAELTHDALHVAETIIPRLRKRHEYTLVCRLLEPFDIRELSPLLVEEYSYALLLRGQVARSEALLQDLLAQNSGGALTFLVLSYIASRRGEGLLDLKLLEKGITLATDEAVKVELQWSKVGVLTSLGRAEEALPLALEMVSYAEERGKRAELALFLHALTRVYEAVGQRDAREATSRRALAIYATLQQLHVSEALGLMNNLANLYREQNRLADAFELLEYALPVAEREHDSMYPLLLETYADVLVSQTSFKEAVMYYQRALPSAQAHELNLLVQRIRYRLSDAARRSNDLVLARRALEEASRGWDGDTVYMKGYREFYRALEVFSNYDAPAARKALEAAAALLEDSELDTRTNLYLLELARREGTLSQKQVAALVKKLDALGHDALLWLDAEPLNLLYNECIAHGWFAERFAPFTKPGLTPNIHERAQPVLYIRTFGDVRVTLGAKLIKLPFAKATELLLWLALYGPASREKIIDALWDGSSDSKHIEYGKLALRRLRTTLAEHVPFNPLVYVERQYQLADTLEIKLDVQDMLNVFEVGDDIARRKALDRYSSTFLPGVTSEWAEAVRTRLHDAAVATAVGLGKLYEHNDLDSALWAYRKVVELEPLLLDGYHALVQLLQAKGDPIGARLAYQTYTRVLITEYGETPSLTFDDMLHVPSTRHFS